MILKAARLACMCGIDLVVQPCTRQAASLRDLAFFILASSFCGSRVLVPDVINGIWTHQSLEPEKPHACSA